MKTKVSIIKCSSYEELKVLKAIRKALKDIDFKIPSKKTILLKPNILLQTTPKKGVTTHPLIVNAICKILTEKHNKVIIGESGGILGKGGTKKAFQVSGIKKIADKYNIKCLSFSEIPTKKIINKNAVIEKEMFLPKILFEVDMIINLPKLKTHSMMLYTGAVKNLYGCIPGGKKQAYHAQTKTYEKFANLLLDIYENIKPQLNIVDGIVAMEGNGPTGGDLKKANIILASKNAIALDIIAEKIMGFENEVLTTNLAIKRKLFSDKKTPRQPLKYLKYTSKNQLPNHFLKKIY